MDVIHSSKWQVVHDLLSTNAEMQSGLNLVWFQIYCRKLVISYSYLDFNPESGPTLLSLAKKLAPKQLSVGCF